MYKTGQKLNFLLLCKKQTDLIYLEFSKWFVYSLSLKFVFKLLRYGVCGVADKWIESFLLERDINVSVNNALRESVSVS